MSATVASHASILALDALAPTIDTVHIVDIDQYEHLESGIYHAETPTIAPATHAVLTLASHDLRPAVDGLSRTRTERVVLDAAETPWIITERIFFQDASNAVSTTVLIAIVYDPMTNRALPLEDHPMITAHECSRLRNVVSSWTHGLAHARFHAAPIAELPRRERKTLTRLAPERAILLTPARIESPGQRAIATAVRSPRDTTDPTPTPAWREAATRVALELRIPGSGLVLPNAR